MEGFKQKNDAALDSERFPLVAMYRKGCEEKGIKLRIQRKIIAVTKGDGGLSQGGHSGGGEMWSVPGHMHILKVYLLMHGEQM